MSSNKPKVLIIGKGKDKNKQKIQDLISTIEPKQIPSNFLYAVYIYMADGAKYRIDTRLLKQGVDYENIETQIRNMGVAYKDIERIEVVVDLDKAQLALSSEVNNFLSPFFTDDD